MNKYNVITEASIEKMVHQFYAKLQHDETIGPIFVNALGQKWDAHLERLCAFWSTVLLTSKSYYGDPFRAHMMVQGIKEEHFQHWLKLFEETVLELYTQEPAQDIMNRANRMAERMKMVLFKPNPFLLTTKVEPS